MNKITIATAVNDDYVFPMCVMMGSVINSLTEGVNASFYILTTGLSKPFQRQLDKSLDGTSADYTEVVIDPSRLHGLKVDGHVTIETYFRLLIPDYLTDVDKVLYLDTDLVVRHSVHGLFQQEFGGSHLLAVPHASKRSGFFGSERGVPSYRSLGIPGMTRTFNAGVMLLNLEAWRADSTSIKILQYLRDYKEQVLWWDQDGLNAVLYNKWLPLAAKWNVMTSHIADFGSWQDSLLDATTFDAIKTDPGIVHFSNSPKPWSPDYKGPFLEYWLEAATQMQRDIAGS